MLYCFVDRPRRESDDEPENIYIVSKSYHKARFHADTLGYDRSKTKVKHIGPNTSLKKVSLGAKDEIHVIGDLDVELLGILIVLQATASVNTVANLKSFK